MFHSYEDDTIAGEGLQIFTYARHLWAIEKWGFFRVSHLLWNGASIYNDHILGHIPLTHVAERLAVELWLPN